MESTSIKYLMDNCVSNESSTSNLKNQGGSKHISQRSKNSQSEFTASTRSTNSSNSSLPEDGDLQKIVLDEAMDMLRNNSCKGQVHLENSSNDEDDDALEESSGRHYLYSATSISTRMSALPKSQDFLLTQNSSISISISVSSSESLDTETQIQAESRNEVETEGRIKNNNQSEVDASRDKTISAGGIKTKVETKKQIDVKTTETESEIQEEVEIENNDHGSKSIFSESDIREEIEVENNDYGSKSISSIQFTDQKTMSPVKERVLDQRRPSGKKRGGSIDIIDGLCAQFSSCKTTTITKTPIDSIKSPKAKTRITAVDLEKIASNEEKPSKGFKDKILQGQVIKAKGRSKSKRKLVKGKVHSKTFF